MNLILGNYGAFAPIKLHYASPLFAIILMAHILHLYILRPAIQHYNCCFIQFCFSLKRDEKVFTLYINHLWHTFCHLINSSYHLQSLPFNVKGFLKSLRMLPNSDVLQNDHNLCLSGNAFILVSKWLFMRNKLFTKQFQSTF